MSDKNEILSTGVKNQSRTVRSILSFVPELLQLQYPSRVNSKYN